MKRIACIILIAAILVSGLAFTKPAHASTVSGTLTADTHWTIVDSPINFNSTVTVANGTTLTIDPGVTVNLQRYSFDIRGTLVAVGTQEQKITFTIRENASQTTTAPIFFSPTSPSWSDETSSGSVIQNAFFDRVILYINNSPKIDSCYFIFSTVQAAINVNGGSPIITNNNIVFSGQDANHYSYGINVNMGSPVISNNQFDGNGYLTGLYTRSQDSLIVSNNVFSNCWSGVKAQGNSALTVDGNSFLRGNDGIDITEGASVTIRNNLIDSNARYGINGGGNINSNTITNNQVGIHNPNAGSFITNNNIVGNRIYSVTATLGNINAQNNWWGTTDVPTINQTIYDIYDDPKLGEIAFVPFLNGPNPSAPAIPPTTPQTTPIPTQTPQPTPTPTIPPTIAPTPTPTRRPEPLLLDTSDLLNLDLVANSVMTLLILAWIIVILGYAVKGGISKYKTRDRKSEFR